jgi:transposase
LRKPTELSLPFGSWTFDRLEASLNEEKGIAIKRSRIDELLIDEGLRWRTQEGWLGERATREKNETTNVPEDKPIDPAFAQKRGRLRPSTPARRRIA